MLSYALNTFSIVLFVLASVGETTLPVNTCKRDSVDYSTCLKHAIEEAWPQFVKGLPEFDVPVLDPLSYKHGKLIINTGEMHMQVVVSNVTATGLLKIYFGDVRSYFVDDIFHVDIDIQVPKIFVKGTVKINGSLSTFRLGGEGDFTINADDVRTTWNLIGPVVNDTWIMKNFRVLPVIKRMKFSFDNLIEGNKELNDIIVAFINEFWPLLYRQLLPIAANKWDPWLVNLGNNFFSKVPFSKLFP